LAVYKFDLMADAEQVLMYCAGWSSNRVSSVWIC
jgi:hypothetical protein